ncbi:uncharacterized protein [Euwallacea similis]|uniref:uncharacterized protein isoform X1 n=2 Tax=Euwallacea similis TaxID=1736056 RepID=UPI00344C56E1
MGLVQTIFHCLIVCSLIFQDFVYVYGEMSKEITEQGRTQYQMIKERGSLPKYGPCWRAALQHLSEGCSHLSEEVQSDIALHITNCFLEMSGHETYNCQSDKKPNLKAICISNMSDRAFNVYTEFYTHTQNICWFLQGQFWHETIAENTQKVGKQLEVSAEHQQNLIKVQKESILLQEKMLKQERFLEKILEDVYVSVSAHQEILKLLTQTVTSLQTWIVGEISWLDSIMFNIFALVLIFLFTASERTSSARLPLFFLLTLNIAIERLICSLYTKYSSEVKTHALYSNLYNFVWYARYAFTFLGAIVILYVALTYSNILEQNRSMLATIRKQNSEILKSVEQFRRSRTPSTITATSIDFIAEEKQGLKKVKDNCVGSSKNRKIYEREHRECSFDLEPLTHFNKRTNGVLDTSISKYQLRSYSRQGTPDSGVVH